MSRTISESGLRYEVPYKGSFTNKRPAFTLNHVLSYRETYDKYGLPRDVMKTIDRDIKIAEDYARARKAGEDPDEKIRMGYFKVIREYYTSEGATNAGMPMAARFAPFLGYKNAVKVVKDLKNLKTQLNKAENKPEFED